MWIDRIVAHSDVSNACPGLVDPQLKSEQTRRVAILHRPEKVHIRCVPERADSYNGSLRCRGCNEDH